MQAQLKSAPNQTPRRPCFAVKRIYFAGTQVREAMAGHFRIIWWPQALTKRSSGGKLYLGEVSWK